MYLTKFVLAVLLLAIIACRPEEVGPPTLTVEHVRTSTVLSRCDECTQPGDLIKIRVQGPSSMLRGIAVYRNELHDKSCFGCNNFSTIVESIGHYVVVGYQLDRAVACLLPSQNFDIDVTTLHVCGALTTKFEFDVR